MVEEAKLFEHLQLLRDYYALGRGELFQQFIVSAEEHLKHIPNRYVVIKLNSIFHETAKKIYSENDKTYRRFELLFPKDDDEKSKSLHILILRQKSRKIQTKKNYNFILGSDWPQIEMNFEIKWPLHIIFHPGAMALYNKLFGFLLRVKKSQIDLQRLWLIHIDGKNKM